MLNALLQQKTGQRLNLRSFRWVRPRSVNASGNRLDVLLPAIPSRTSPGEIDPLCFGYSLLTVVRFANAQQHVYLPCRGSGGSTLYLLLRAAGLAIELANSFGDCLDVPTLTYQGGRKRG